MNNPNALDSGTMGPLLAIDPANSNIVFDSNPGTGASNGLYYTTNGTNSGGATWHLVPSSSVAQSSSFFTVAFDPSSPVSGGATQGIYVCSYGTGCYHSPNGGSTWTSIVSGGPTTVIQEVVDQDGHLWVSDSSNNVWKYSRFVE